MFWRLQPAIHRGMLTPGTEARTLKQRMFVSFSRAVHIGVHIGSAFPAFYMYRRTRRRCGDAARSSSFKRQFSDPRSNSASLSVLVPQLCLLGNIDPAGDAGQR